MGRRTKVERAPDANQSCAMPLIQAPHIGIVVAGLRLMRFTLFKQHATIGYKYGSDCL